MMHGALKVVPTTQHRLDPANLRVPVRGLERRKLVGHGGAVGREQGEEALGDAPGLLDGGGDVGVVQGPEVLKRSGNVVEELVAKGVGAAKLGALVADARQVADEQLVGKDFNKDVDEGVVQDGAVVAHVLVEGDDHLLHGGGGVPAGRKKVGHDGLEVDGKDELRKLVDAPGAAVDVAVAQGGELLLDALEVLRGDVGFEFLAEAREVAEARLVVAVVDAGNLVVCRGDEPVLQRLEALEVVDGLARHRLVAQGLVLEHALLLLLAGAQARKHGVNDALDHVGALRRGGRVDLLAQHAPQRDQVLGAKVAVLVLVEVGGPFAAAAAAALGKVARLLRKDALDPLVEEADNELPKVAHQLGLAVVNDVRREVRLRVAHLGHFSVVLFGEADDFERVRRRGLGVVDHADEKVVHERVVAVGVELANVPFLRHERRHADADGVEVVEEPGHDFFEALRVVEELFAGGVKLLLGAELDGLEKLGLVAANLFGAAVGDALEADGDFLVVLEGVLQGEHAAVAALLGLHDDGEADDEAVVVVEDEIDEVHGNQADVLVEPVDHVVEAGKVVLERGLEARVVGALNLLHGVVANVAQLRELVVARQQVGHVFLVIVVLAQHALDHVEAAVKRLEVAAHRLDGGKVAVRLRDEVDARKVVNHGLRLGAQPVNLHHLVLDELHGALAVGEAGHARLRPLELLAQAPAQLPVDGALFAREFLLEPGDLVEVVGVSQQLRELGYGRVIHGERTVYVCVCVCVCVAVVLSAERLQQVVNQTMLRGVERPVKG
ncbi:hypothetical protein HC256_009899 [Beauveria bassiana]|nr:hypothetical protein HC256_009899 [Beauveria bassiana]